MKLSSRTIVSKRLQLGAALLCCAFFHFFAYRTLGQCAIACLSGDFAFCNSGGQCSADPNVLSFFQFFGDCINATVTCNPPPPYAVGTTLVTCSATATDSSGNQAHVSCTFNVVVNDCPADLALTKTVDKKMVKIGQTLSYLITVVNNGPNTATGVVISDTTPAGTTFLTATTGSVTPCLAADSLSAPTLGGTGPITATFNSLASGQCASLKYLVTVIGGTSGPISNSAQVHSSTCDPNLGNNSATVTTRLIGKK